MIKLEEKDPFFDQNLGIKDNKATKNSIPSPLSILSNENEDQRVNVLTDRYGHVKRTAHKLNPGEVSLHMKIDSQTINQGKCFYNPVQDIYFVRAKRNVNARKQKDDRIFLEVEKYEELSDYKSITFYITGICLANLN